MTRFSSQKGFVALMTVIIISAILVVFVYLLSTASFLERFDALDVESKRVSLGLAEACINAATLKIAQGDFTTDTVVVDPTDPEKICKICQIDQGGLITARAVYHGAYTNLFVVVDTLQITFPITAWDETGAYSGPACPLP